MHAGLRLRPPLVEGRPDAQESTLHVRRGSADRIIQPLFELHKLHHLHRASLSEGSHSLGSVLTEVSAKDLPSVCAPAHTSLLICLTFAVPRYSQFGQRLIWSFLLIPPLSSCRQSGLVHMKFFCFSGRASPWCSWHGRTPS